MPTISKRVGLSFAAGERAALLRRRDAAHPSPWLLGFLCWLPLLLSGVFDLFAHATVEPIVRDLGVHARLLLAIPLFVAANRILALRCADVVERLARQRLTDDWRALDRFSPDPTLRLRALDVLLLAVAIGLGQALFWHLLPSSGVFAPGTLLTRGPASAWYAWVAFPAFFFCGLRLLFRWAAWSVSLWHFSRLELRTIATHPDQAGGIGFIAKPLDAIALWVLGMSSVAAAAWASQILAGHVRLAAVVEPLAIYVCITLALAFVPLLAFVGCLFRSRRAGLRQYGRLALIYTRLFHERWIAREPGPELLGTPDIQSLCDLQSSYHVTKSMRLVPFGMRQVSMLLLAVLSPFVPLLLTEIPLSKLVLKAIETVVGVGH